MNQQTDLKRFIRTPKAGDIVKVYKRGDSYFGICKGITYEKRNERLREIAIVKRTSQRFNLSDCSLYVESEKVIEQ